MKIAITGGNGFLGTNVAIRAKEKGYDVICVDNLVRKGSERNKRILKEKFNIDSIDADVRELDQLFEIKADAIIHLAGQPGIPKSLENPIYDFHVNALGTLHVLEWSRMLGNVPVIYASTNKIYSDVINKVPLVEGEKRYDFNVQQLRSTTQKSTENVLLSQGVSRDGVNENFPMDGKGYHPHSPYGVSKATGDLLMQEYYHAFDVPTVVMRMSCIYGLYQNGVSEQGWTDYFVRERLGDNKLTFFGNGKQVRDTLYGTDAADAYLTALERIDIAKGKVYNLGGGKINTSLIEYVDLLNRLVDKEPMEITYSDWRLADHRVYVSDTKKIEKELGWTATTDLETGTRAMIDAYNSDLYK